MGYILDTSIAVLLRDGDADTLARLDALAGDVSISVVTRVELEGGVYREAALSPQRRFRLDLLLATLPTLSFTDAHAQAYGQIVATAGYSRRKLLDRMIAAQALVHRATLVTLNPGDFSDVPGLKLVDWSATPDP